MLVRGSPSGKMSDPTHVGKALLLLSGFLHMRGMALVKRSWRNWQTRRT